MKILTVSAKADNAYKHYVTSDPLCDCGLCGTTAALICWMPRCFYDGNFFDLKRGLLQGLTQYFATEGEQPSATATNVWVELGYEPRFHADPWTPLGLRQPKGDQS